MRYGITAGGNWIIDLIKFVVMHFPEGAVGTAKEKNRLVREKAKSLNLLSGFIKGTVGAGDAICAGCLHVKELTDKFS